MSNYDYKRLCPFKWFVIENFPFIEADFDALTNWQLFEKLGYEINKLINSMNLAGEQVESLTNAFNELESYVNNYFENLDVQDEINEKLDKMVQTGAFNPLLENLFASYNEQFDLLEANINNNYEELTNKINVNQTVLLNQLQSIASGSPAGVYDTLEALEADTDADHSKIYVVSSNGYWYYYNTTTEQWTAGGTYLANLTVTGITPNQLSFMEQKILNIFDNDNTAELAEGIIGSNGTIDTTQTQYYTTPFMPVSPGTTYYKYNNYTGVWYDENKDYISGTGYGYTTVTAPSNARYFRTSMLKTVVANFYVSTVNRWSKYGFNPFYITDKNLIDLIQSLANLNTKTYINDTDFFNTTDTNIFNTKNLYEDYALSGAGKLISNVGFSTTDFLKLPQPTGTLYVSESYTVIEYDSSYNITAVHDGNNTTKSFSIAENTAYIRLTVSDLYLANALVLLNETAEQYEARTKYALQFRTQEQLLSIIAQLCNNETFQSNIIDIVSGSPITSTKWCAIGDSWTEENQTATNNYVKRLTASLNLETTNLGISGTGFKRGEDNENAYYQRTDNIPASTQILTIMGSGNDLGAGYTLGNPTDSGTTTICGCINTTLDNVYARFPGIRIGLISLGPWQNYPPNTSNAFGNYTTAMKAIAEARGIPFLDLYHSSNLRPWVSSFRTTYMPDGVHPNDNGTDLFVNRIKEFVKSL